MKHFLLGLAIAASAPFAVAQAPMSADPLDTLVVAYEAFEQETNPDTAARLRGQLPRQWQDVRPEAVTERANRAAALIRRIKSTPTRRTVDQQILLRLLQVHVDAAAHDAARIPFTGDWGFQAEPLFAAMQTRLVTVQDAEAWIARLEDVPRYFEDNVNNMRRGVETGWTAHPDPLATMTSQIREQIVTSPESSALYKPFLALGPDIEPAEAVRLATEGRAAVENVIGAYRSTLTFIQTDYSPHARTDAGISEFPGGKAAYAAAVAHHTAGAGFTPEDIHALGKSEVVRIRAEMESIIRETGFRGSFSEFLVFLRTDRQFYATSAEDLLEKASAISKRLDAIMPQYFGKLPRLPYGVSPVPDAIAPGYTTGRYVQGDPDEGRSGTYLVNTYALDQRPLYELPALSAHEAVPGHHMQIALAQEMDGQPRFRREYYATAFGEGWGLYAERIAGEAGIYTTPYERFGALSYEMWRACRLVSDTGLHWYGWSRREAEACFRNNTALAPLNIETEVTRYIGWPGQATAYKVGELKIRALRKKAEDALGSDFDIRAFHDAVLAEGAVPLDLLEKQIDRHIQRRRAMTQIAP
jgi:uncharacterized protein (DUF885 family)